LQQLIETPACIAKYWDAAITPSVHSDSFREACFVIALTARYRVLGHYLAGTGTLNSVSIHAQDVFRIAILANAYAIVLVHNHPSGDPTPSGDDLRVTRELVRAGGILKIDIYDHLIIAAKSHVSLRVLGHCFP